MGFQTKVEVGKGIYTISEISLILRVPYNKVHRYISQYWDGKFSGEYVKNYSWVTDKSRAVNFYTLIELDTFIKLTDAGVPTKKLINAHNLLVQKFSHPYPLALKSVMERVKSAGKRVFFEENNETIISLDGTNQITSNFITHFYEKIDFVDDIAEKLWPLGKDKDIVCDPTRQFGYPTIAGTRIYPDTIYDLYKNGEKKKFIADSYELTIQQVENAIKFCSQAA
ncbi:DUF433 domain-containing protein [Muricauda sp. CAU 1633]|uniref:DUF433 domain-containing protein n=1 Tax=Allomuricauda sp. CAU 1633 TaxID=2816036 RepID=UPI001A8C1CFA|nr:DUF433 domain-containing protein [Muricauda sp. CAU 1633]MBO0324333.1 DUF433 domain-containing protein [Muricauda sp. CAU 1633]